MGWPQCNSTSENEKIHEDEVWKGLTYHHLGLILSAIFGLIAVVVSFYLIFMHATHYLKPWEQRHVIRILFMVPVYATVSFLSFLYYRHSVYFEVLRDCYEAFAIASFFTLLCHYVADDLHQQKNYFRTIRPKSWVWPIPWVQRIWGGQDGLWRTPRSGLTWFNIIWTCVFQYCFIRVLFTCVAVITQVFDKYCQESLNPAFAHIWVMGIEAVAVTIAMFAIIQFYVQLKGDIRQHKPLLKVAAIKLVIFLSFWQTIVISVLTGSGLIHASNKFQTPDIKIGIPAMLLCIEMAIFAVFHLWAFPWQPYRLTSKMNMAESVPGYNISTADYKGGFLGFRAILHAFNPWDLFKAVGRSARWLFVGRKHRTLDSSYNPARQSTGSTLGLEPTAKQDRYASPSPHGSDMRNGYGRPSQQNGKPAYAASDNSAEGEELLTHAQSNPTSGPAPPIFRNFKDESNPGDIGVAHSVYGNGHDGYHTAGDQPPMPSHLRGNLSGRTGGQLDSRQTHFRRGEQETGVVPYPDNGTREGGNRSNAPAQMPYFPPPPTYERQHGRS